MSKIEQELHNFIEDMKANLLRAKTTKQAQVAIKSVKEDLAKLEARLCEMKRKETT